MGIRNIRQYGDEILRKKSKAIINISERDVKLIKDMIETMHKADGVGLAAPQVGILKRIIVIDITEDGSDPFALVNPEIVESSGSYIDSEGCLSLPEEQGEVVRPTYVKVKGLNVKGEKIIIEGEQLLARALCHEIDHLDGILFIDKLVKKEE